MTITLDPPAVAPEPDALDHLGVHALTADPAAPDRRISFAALWARAEAEDAPVVVTRARVAASPPASAPAGTAESGSGRPRRAAPGQVGGVHVVPAVLDLVAPPTPAAPARPGARVWFVDEPDGLLDDAAPEAAEPARPPARLLVSPEFERRRAAVEAEIRRRARQPLLWLLLAVVVAVLGLLTLVSPLMSVRHVDVRGVDAATAATIRAAAEPLVGTPLVRVDPVVIVRRLQARVDIAAVRVEKDWPNRIVISPAMRRPMAVLRAKGTADRVIDESGAVMSERAGVGLALPVIAVDATDALHRSAAVELRQLREAALVVRSIGPTLRSRLTKVDRYGDEYVLRFGAANVRIGRATDLPAKTAALNALASAGQLDHAGTIDVSVPDTVIVTGLSATAKNTTKTTKHH